MKPDFSIRSKPLSTGPSFVIMCQLARRRHDSLCRHFGALRPRFDQRRYEPFSYGRNLREKYTSEARLHAH